MANELRLVRLQTFVHFDLKTGFVWGQLYDRPDTLDWNQNWPHRPLRLISDPFMSDGRIPHFGKLIPVLKNKVQG